jgi:Xaa-Pro aminopeptidase
MRLNSISSALFKENRARFIGKIKDNSIAIFHSNDLMPRNGDCFFPFRQNSDLFYMTGINQEETTLLLFPNASNENWREVLFIRKTNEQIAIWEGHKYTQEEAKEISGISNIIWGDNFESFLGQVIPYASSIYTNINENDRFYSDVVSKDYRFTLWVKEKFPALEIERAAPLMMELRSMKHPLEIEITQKACNITKDAFERVLRFTKPGVKEYEIEAEITHEFIKQEANGHAYEPIIASGRDSCVLHYISNNKVCKDGDILLMDFGAEYANYAADLSRTIPVNGKFTKRQKAVYNACLHVMKEATQMLIPGNTLDKINKEVGKIMESELLKLKLLTKADIQNQDNKTPAYKKYFMHGISHFLGLDVHDIGNRYEPIQAGMLFTCEPGIYILEENLGVRIENDILVTDSKPIDLMQDIPIEADHIEEIMNKK